MPTPARYRNPPAAVLLTVQPICLMFRGRFKHKVASLPKGDKPPTWEEAKLLLNNDSFIPDLQTFNKDSVDERQLAAIAKITRSTAYDPIKLGSASQACQYLSQWVLAIVAYAEVRHLSSAHLCIDMFSTLCFHPGRGRDASVPQRRLWPVWSSLTN